MSSLSGERWRALSGYLDQALEMSVEERGPWLADLRLHQPCVAADLTDLLAAQDAIVRDRFLESTRSEALAHDGRLLARLTHPSRAESSLRATLDVHCAMLGDTHRETAASGSVLTHLRDALRRQQGMYAADDWRIAATKSALGAALTALGQLDVAVMLVLYALGVLVYLPGRLGRDARATRERLTALQQLRHRPR